MTSFTPSPGEPQSGLPRDLDPDSLAPEALQHALRAYLDGELSDAEARVMQGWIESEPERLLEVERLRRLDELLGHYPDEAVPEAFAAGVFDAVGMKRPATGDGQVVQMSWYRHPAVVATGLASMAAALLLAFGLAVRAPTASTTPDAVEPAMSGSVAALESLPDEVFEDLDAFELIVDLDDDAVDAALVGGFEDLELQGG